MFKFSNFWGWFQKLGVGIVGIYTFSANCAIAQVTSDDTIPSNSIVTREGNTWNINGGTRAGNNLFHSFNEFSLPTGSAAFFNNSADIQNIISRVTGGSISNIDGLIRANGIANLFLINPNGILFGQNARLDIGGSFVASTASSLKFADGFEFSATTSQSAPLLTISVPVGLQFGQNPAAIRVQGTGHDFTVASPIFSPVTRSASSTGLRVQPGQTLALVGGNISLDGGTLTAERGRVELGSVAGGLVSLNPTSGGWTFGYEEVLGFGDIELSQKALADASGVSGGFIQVQGRNLSVRDGSLVLIQNQGLRSAGAIKVNTRESVKVSGTNADGTIRSSLTNETVGAGKGGDVELSTQQLVVEEGGTIVAKTLSPATGGNVNINAFDSIQVNGASAVNPSVTSSIVAATFGPGDSGNNTVSTGRLTTTGGGTVASASFGTGEGGNLSVNATDSIEIFGVEPNLFSPSGFLASAFNAGDAGNLTVNTPRLTLQDGGRVGASAFASGAAGNVTINVPEFVEIKGTVPGSVNPSLVSSSANLVDQSLQQLFGLPPVPSGASGDVTINTGQLKVTDGALVTTSNNGSGISGNIRINARSVFLDGGAAITSELGGTFVGGKISVFSPFTVGAVKGGDIAISAQQFIVQKGAGISTATFTNTAGGNVNVDVSDFVQVDGFVPFNPRALSFIGSSTFGSGKSGNVNISTGQLRVLNGSRVGAGTFGKGSSGDVAVNATESVEVIGAELSQSVGSLIGVSTLNDGNGGNLTINTPKLIVQDGGRIDSSTLASGLAGSITINASESVDVSGKILGTDEPSLISAGATIENEFARRLFGLPPVPSGSSGDVTINTGQLKITDGALVSTRSDGSGTSGNVRINARSIFLDNKGGITSEIGGTIAAGLISVFSPVTIGGGKGGDIAISTQQLAVRGGSSISTATFTNAPGGNVTIDASDSVEVSGAGPFQSPVSFLGVSTFNTGDVGDITINTGKLAIRDGGRIDSLTTTSGSTGNIAINASKSVEVSGKLPGTSIPSLISAGANIENEFALQIFGLPPSPTGASGDVTIDTDQLIIKDGALVTVSNQGAGDAGNLKVTSRSIRLDNQGKLTANSAAGTEGNILLKVRDLLLLRRNSEISAVSGTAKTGGSGGNFIADVGFIVAVPSENSDILTNAFTGRGGNITIRSDGIFGTQFRQQQTSESDIVASGRVIFNTPNVDPSSGLIELPTNIVDPTQQISTACTPGSPQRQSSFVVTGRGGLPLSATELLQDTATLAEWVRSRGKPTQAQMQLQPTKVATASAPIVEASGWIVDANGDIQLVTQAPVVTPHNQWLPSASCPVH
jgi:filamentous hemagglutinin family protein